MVTFPQRSRFATQFGAQLLQQALQPRPVVNPLQGLAQVAQAGLGGLLTARGIGQQQEQDEARQQAIRQFVMGGQGLPPSTQVAGAPGTVARAGQPGAVVPAAQPPDQLAQLLAGPAGQDPFIQQLAVGQIIGREQRGQETAARRQERAEDRAFRTEQAALDRDLRRSMARQDREFRRQETNIDRQFKLTEARLGGGNLKPSDVAGLRKEFTGQSKNFETIRDSFVRMNSVSQDPSAAGDLALVFNFMKVLDPGSVVRESEFATAQNAAGVPDRIRALWNNLKRGQRMAPAQRTDFLEQAGNMFDAQLQQQLRLEDQFTGISERLGANPANVVVDFVGQDLRQRVQPAAQTQAPAEPSQPSQGQATEGTIVENQAGERLILRNGQWVPFNG